MNTHSDFASRHIGPQGEERREMLDSLGYRTLDELIADIVPADIRMKAPLDLPAAKSETEALEELRSILRKNKLLKTFIGRAITAPSLPPSSSAMYWRTPAGTRPTPLINRKSPRDGWKCS